MDSSPDTLQVAVVAALLHDIGLIAQRAADPLLPSTDHAPLAAAFAAERLPAALRPASAVILAHHRPDDRLSRIVAAADRLAAGGPDDEDPARPILQRLSPLATARGGRTAAYHEIATLSVDPDALTPRTAPLDREAIRQRLGELAETFATEHTTTMSSDVPTYLEGLLDLLDRVAWAVPAPSREATIDISLRDHLRTAGALAACLTLDGTADEYLNAIIAGDAAALERPCALLVRGDLRGDLIAKSPDPVTDLRGQSLALDLLAAAIADWTLNRFGAPVCCRLYVGSRGFSLVAPIAAGARLEEIGVEINRRLILAFEGDLLFTLAGATISGAAAGAGAGDTFSRLNQAAARQAGRELGALGVAEQARVFQPRGDGTGAACVCCGRDAMRDADRCLCCAEIHGLGAALDGAVAVLSSDIAEPANGEGPGIASALASFGRAVKVVTAEHGLSELPAGAIRARLERFGPPATADPALRAWAQRQMAPVALISQLRARYRPAHRLAEPLGVLRADVDSFDAVLGIGQDESPSLAGWSGLLMLAKLFVTGALDTLVERFEPERAAVLSSGGDELTIAGRVDVLPDLAHRINVAFRAFAGMNPALHLSAAVVAVPEGRSMIVAVRAAGEALQRRAKRHQRPDGPPKDALDLLGTTIGWEQYQQLFMSYRRFVDLIERRSVPRSLVQAFLAADAQATAARAPGADRPVYGRWLWRIAQQLRGLAAQGLPEPDLNNFLNDLRRPDGLARLTLAARWADLATRPAHPEE